VFIPRFVSVIAEIAKYVGNSYEKLKWVARWEEREEVFNLCHKTLEEMVSLVIKSGKGYHISWSKENGGGLISIYIAAPEKLYIVRALRPIRVRQPKNPLKYKVSIEEKDYTAENITILGKYGITTTIYGIPLSPKTASEQQSENETATVDVVK
jgi:hypothetical protein